MSHKPTHRVFLIPGMFGFARLAGYDYFIHVERALERRFREAGARAAFVIVPSPPTASLRRRAEVAGRTIHAAAGAPGDPIHLVGHSTGGLDARLLTAPAVRLALPEGAAEWRARVRSVVTVSTPHRGTPLAQFFTTVAGTRLLYALSLLTFATLRFGRPSLTVLSSLVAGIGGVDETLGLDVRVLNRVTRLILRFVGDTSRDEVEAWLDGIRRDQGGIIQLTPEAMDLFNAAVTDAPGVRYGYVATSAPPPHALRFAKKVRSPYAALSATVYSTLYAIASRPVDAYGCPVPSGAEAALLRSGLGVGLGDALSDGVVPTLSMPWGELLWAGRADHLDVLGHFDARSDAHVDWLHSGASFTSATFTDSMDAIAAFLLRR